jgi:hypothetical protein
VLNTKDLITDIKLYPNPVRDILNVSNTTSEDYKIFDMGGKLINSGKLERGSVNVSSLIKGAYIIQIGEVSRDSLKTNNVIKLCMTARENGQFFI